MCDRVAFLVNGKIAALDTPKSLKLKYGQPSVVIEYAEGGELKSATLSMAGESKAELQRFIGDHDVKTIHSGEPSLEEIFIKLTGVGLE